jgi:hypothetical protein
VILDKNLESKITVEDFVESYIKFQEKIKLLNTKIAIKIRELNYQNQKDEKSFQEHLDEKKIENGLTENSNLYVTIFEAKDLSPNFNIGTCDPFVLVSLGDESQKTLVKKSTNNPAWNENFKFKVNNPDLTLKISVFDQTMIGSRECGYVSMPLKNFADQEKVISWYDLYKGNSPSGNGKIYCKIQYIHSLKKYYLNCIEKNKKMIDFLEQSLLTTDYYVKNCEQESFGIFLFGKIDQLLNKNLFVQCERILNSIEQRNQTFFAQREYKDENKYNNCRIF